MINEANNFRPQPSWREETPANQPPPFRPFFLFTALFILIAAAWGAACIFAEEPSNDPADYEETTFEPVKPKGVLRRIGSYIFTKEVELQGQSSDRINVLFLGMGGEGHDGPYLTDTIMIVSIKPSTKQVAIISIPRDLGVNIPSYGIRKINSANALAEAKEKGSGLALTQKTIEKTFDLEIHYIVRVDFKAVEEIIDALGGIKVNVEKSFTDTQYPDKNNGYQTIAFTKGIQTLNGEKSLQFARSRHASGSEGSDFARARRQQPLLLALKEKVVSFSTLGNPVHLHNIYTSLNRHIATNLEFSDLIAFLKLSQNLNNDIIPLVLDNGPDGSLVSTIGDTGAFLLFPKTGNFKNINRQIAEIFNPTKSSPDPVPIIAKQDAPTFLNTKIEIQNGTWRAGLASRIKNNLTTKGFAVHAVGNTQNRPQSASGIYVVSKEKHAAAVSALQTLLNIPAKQDLPDNEIFSDGSDIVVILGDDYIE